MPPKEKPLMQRLFQGKKTAYSPSDLNMQSTRIRSLRNENSFFFSILNFIIFFSSRRIGYYT